MNRHWFTGKIKPAGPRKLRIEVSIPEGITMEQATDYISQFFNAESDVCIQGKDRNDVLRTMNSDDTLEIRVPQP